MEVKISIITATYNSALTINNCINSINSQTYRDIEHVIVDGASTDGTVDIIKKNSAIPRLNLLSEPDNGIYSALNKGLMRATGDIVGFLHSDDYYPNSEVLQNVIKQFYGNPLVDGVYGDLNYIDRRGQKIVRYWKSSVYRSGLLREGWMPPHPTLFLRKSAYDEIGLFDISYKISADYDFLIRLFSCSRFNFKYFPEILYFMRTGGASNRSLAAILEKTREDYSIIKKNRLGGLGTLILKNASKISQFFK